MNEQDKQLLLTDLCGRLLYYPIVHVEHDIGGFIETADLQVYGYEGKLKLLREDNETFCYLPIEECKPYLRPMSSMTYEEKLKYYESLIMAKGDVSCVAVVIDWLTANHFDYRGLIEKGLAIETPNNMYKEQQ